MKLQRIAESYEGLEDADEFVNKPYGVYSVDQYLEEFINLGNISGDLEPILNENNNYLVDIKGRGRFSFPVQSEHRADIEQLLLVIDEDWASEFNWSLRSAIINALLRSKGLDENMEDDWRMDMIVHESGFYDDPIAWVEVSFK
jgi:hypothetical protein